MSIKTCNKDTLYNALDKIKELEEQLANATKTDEELVKDVAY